ncbi:Adenosylcobinamide-phosphate guanylyltransferase [hydrothermal vent metagenome]|uniref:Adenosylcobinamide kinase n=1 Tax=hydrothermal vent metagenome TaxID=652676 RepID=A0A1W1D637_9ZZZZ
MQCKKVLFIGGIKSGKSKLAEEYILQHSKTKPIYLATNEFFDAEMEKRVLQHQKQRQNTFDTLEEPVKLYDTLQQLQIPVLVEGVSMWINNMLYRKFTEEVIYKEIERVCTLDNDIVFVLDDVGCSVVSEYKLVRQFVDINGRVAQILASNVDEVYHVVAGIATKIK